MTEVTTPLLAQRRFGSGIAFLFGGRALAEDLHRRPLEGSGLVVSTRQPASPLASRGEGEERNLAQATNEELMGAYVAGNPLAFDALYTRVSPKLFGYLLRLARNRSRAEDLLQITFTKIHRARASYLEGAPFLPWASAIARRTFFDEIRSARSRREDLSTDGSLPEPVEAPPVETSELEDALERALDDLPEAYREAIQLTKVTGLSMQEAALVLGTTPTAVKLRVHRGYVALRKALEPVAPHQGGEA
jgi:RNA polymerase sigma-70 factor, ECF subfamily